MSAVQASLQRIFVECLEAMLRPIVRLTLYCGLGYSEFSAATRRVFIEVATKDYGVRGRPANVARVAAKTGLPRKVIQRLRTQPEKVEWTPDDEVSPLNTIIHYWRFDERFYVSPGFPKPLKFEGEDSFSSLVKSCAGDIPVTAIRQELLREGVASIDSEGSISLDRDYSFPDRLDEDFLRNAAFSVQHLGETILHNAGLVHSKKSTPDDHIERGRFERLVWSRHLDARGADEFQRWVRNQGEEFILEAESHISQLEDLDATKPGLLSGVGVFYFRGD